MATARELMEPALTEAFSSDYFGQEVTYAGAPIQAIFKWSENPKARSQGSSSTAFLHVMNSDVPVWVYNDSVVIDGETWRVKGEAAGSTWFKTVLKIDCDRRPKP